VDNKAVISKTERAGKGFFYWQSQEIYFIGERFLMVNNKIRTTVFLTIHLAVVALIFSLSYFGISFLILLAVATTAFFLETMYLIIFNRAKISKIANKLNTAEKEVTRFREESLDSERIHRELLYIGHQLKSIQTEMDFLKRHGTFKANGNGHHKGVHI